KKLEARFFYTPAEYGSAEGHQRCGEKLDELDRKLGATGNRLYYIATPPDVFDDIITCLGERELSFKRKAGAGVGVVAADSKTWHRIIIEKPFGRDLASARHLNDLLHKYFDEGQVFRIDHYLGKETVQNLMVLRFANSIFEPIWNYKYIDHVQITVAEELGV